jgi:hypothetical protein
MKCAKCGTEIPDQAVFCPNCGMKAAPPANVCQRCQNPLLPGAQFCNSCGAQVAVRKENVPVICPQCNHPVKPGVLFCPNCGFRQPGAAQPNPPAERAYYAPPVPANPPYIQPAPQPYPLPYAQPYAQAYGQPGAKAPRKHKGLVIVVIVLLVLAAAAGGIYLLFGNKIGRLFMGTEASYKQIEKKALRDSSAELVDNMVDLTSENVIPEKGGYDVTLKLGLDENLPNVDPSLVAALDNISIKSRLVFDRNTKAPKFFGTVDLMVEEEKLLTLEASYNEDQVVVGLPGILEKYIYASKDSLTDLVGKTGANTEQATGALDVMSDLVKMDLGINGQNMKATFNKTIDIMLDHVDKVEKESNQSLAAGGVTAKYDLYTMTISKESTRKMLIEILESLRDDKEIFNLVSKVSSLAAASGEVPVEEMTLDSYKKAIDDLIADVKDEENGEDFTLVQKVYAGKNDEVFGRDLLVTSKDGEALFHLQYANPVDGSKEGISLLAESEGQSYSLSGSYTVKDEAKTGSVSLYKGTDKVASITFKDLVEQEVDSVKRLLGEATINIEQAGENYTGPTSFSIKTWMQKDQYWLSLGVPDYFSLEIGYNEVPASSVSFPAYQPDKLVDMSDSEALQGLMTEDAMAKLQDIVAKLGFSTSDSE